MSMNGMCKCGYCGECSRRHRYQADLLFLGIAAIVLLVVWSAAVVGIVKAVWP